MIGPEDDEEREGWTWSVVRLWAEDIDIEGGFKTRGDAKNRVKALQEAGDLPERFFAATARLTPAAQVVIDEIHNRRNSAVQLDRAKGYAAQQKSKEMASFEGGLTLGRWHRSLGLPIGYTGSSNDFGDRAFYDGMRVAYSENRK